MEDNNSGFEAMVLDRDIVALDWICDTLELMRNSAAHTNRMLWAETCNELAVEASMLRSRLNQQDRRTLNRQPASGTGPLND